MLEIKSVGDRLKKGTYTFHSGFSKVLNYSNGLAFVSIVDEDIGEGPLNIVLKELPKDRTSTLEISEDILQVGNQKINYTDKNRYNSRLDFISIIDKKKFYSNLLIFEDILLASAPPMSLAFLLDENRKFEFKTPSEKAFVNRMESGVKKMFSGAWGSGVWEIKGLGFGLTPSGDDFIAGVMLGLHLESALFKLNYDRLISNIYKDAKGNNLISNSFLSCAKDGVINSRLKNLIHSIAFKSEEDITRATLDIISQGETSGADLAVGFLIALTKRRWSSKCM